MAKSIKGTEPQAEKFKQKSKTNKIQYVSTAQAVQTMLAAGAERQIMAANTMASHEIDRSEINETGIKTNNYRAEKTDIIDEGRRAAKQVHTEVKASREKQE